MIQVDVPLAVATGCLIADAAHRQIRQGRAEYCFRAASKNLLFLAFGFSWIPAYFLANYFGWQTTHMWFTADSIAAYPLFWPLFLVVFFAAGVAGFESGRRLIARGRAGANRAVYIAIAGYIVVWVAAQPDRTLRLGTYREWSTGSAPWLWQDPRFLWAMGISIVVSLALLIWTCAGLWREGRHLDPK